MASVQGPKPKKGGKKVTPATAQEVEKAQRPSSAMSHNCKKNILFFKVL